MYNYHILLYLSLHYDTHHFCPGGLFSHLLVSFQSLDYLPASTVSPLPTTIGDSARASCPPKPESKPRQGNPRRPSPRETARALALDRQLAPNSPPLETNPPQYPHCLHGGREVVAGTQAQSIHAAAGGRTSFPPRGVNPPALPPRHHNPSTITNRAFASQNLTIPIPLRTPQPVRCSITMKRSRPRQNAAAVRRLTQASHHALVRTRAHSHPTHLGPFAEILLYTKALANRPKVWSYHAAKREAE